MENQNTKKPLFSNCCGEEIKDMNLFYEQGERCPICEDHCVAEPGDDEPREYDYTKAMLTRMFSGFGDAFKQLDELNIRGNE